MHWYCYNKVILVLNKAESLIFESTGNFKNSRTYLHFVCWMASQPAVRPGCTRCKALKITQLTTSDLRNCCFEDNFPLVIPLFFLPILSSLSDDMRKHESIPWKVIETVFICACLFAYALTLIQIIISIIRYCSKATFQTHSTFLRFTSV